MLIIPDLQEVATIDVRIFQIQSTISVTVAALLNRARLQTNDTPFAPSGQVDRLEPTRPFSSPALFTLAHRPLSSHRQFG
jgi:hypothetical protein